MSSCHNVRSRPQSQSPSGSTVVVVEGVSESPFSTACSRRCEVEDLPQSKFREAQPDHHLQPLSQRQPLLALLLQALSSFHHPNWICPVNNTRLKSSSTSSSAVSATQIRKYGLYNRFCKFTDTANCAETKLTIYRPEA